jgi:hypothetical protein
MTSPEIPRKSSESSTLLVSRLRTTLDEQWKKFDNSLPALKTLSAQYNTLKSGYDALSGELSQISDDNKLKANTSIQSKIDSFLIEIAQHLTDATRDKQYDSILQETQSKVSSLRNQIFWESQTPSVQAEVKNLWTEAIAATTVAVNEWISSLKSEAEWVKKNPIGKLIEAIWWDNQKIWSELKEAFAEKKAGGFGGIFAWLKLLFWSFVAKMGKINMVSQFSPEEISAMDPAMRERLGVPVAAMQEAIPEKTKNTLDKRYTASRTVFSGLFLDKSLPTTEILDNITMKWTALDELKKVHESGGHEVFLSKIGILKPNESNIRALKNILETLFGWKPSKYILEVYNSANWLDKSTAIPLGVTFASYLISSSNLLSRMKWVTQMMLTQQMPTSNISVEKNELKLWEKSEEEDTLSLFWWDKKILEFLLISNASQKVSIKKTAETLDSIYKNSDAMSSLYPNEAERKEAIAKIQKVLNFWEKFMNTISTNPNIHLGMGPKLQNIVDSRDFSLGWLTLLYISLEWKDISNFEQLSTIEQTQIYGAVFTVFNESDSFDKWNLTMEYLNKLNKSKLAIPVWVKEFVNTTTQTLGSAAAKWFWESLKYASGMAIENPWLAISLIISNLPIIPKRDSLIGLFLN